MYLKNFLVTVLCFSFIFCGCSKKNNNIVDNKQQLLDTVNLIINTVDNVDIEEYQNQYNSYYVEDGFVYGINYNINNSTNTLNLFETIEGSNGLNGVIVKNINNDMFLSVENNMYCVIKDFKDSEVSVYDISDKNSCHRLYTDDNNIKVNVSGIKTSNYDFYQSGTNSNDYVSLNATNNIFDKNSYTYTWYRNNEQIENSNIDTYVITSKNENAYYHVELLTYNGQLIESEKFHVIINR